MTWKENNWWLSSISLDTILLVNPLPLLCVHWSSWLYLLNTAQGNGGKLKLIPHVVLLLLSMFFEKLIPCGILNSTAAFLCSFSSSCVAMFHELIADLVLLSFSVRRKVASLFVAEKSHVFDLLRSNQTVSVCHGPVQPAGEIYCLIPTRGRAQESHRGLKHAATTYRSSALVTRETGCPFCS